MNYKFANLLGAPYRGGNLLLHGPELLSPVGNRVSQVRASRSRNLATALRARRGARARMYGVATASWRAGVHLSRRAAAAALRARPSMGFTLFDSLYTDQLGALHQPDAAV